MKNCETVAKPYSIHYRTHSHPRLGVMPSTPFKFHSSYETEALRNAAFDLLSQDIGRTSYMKVDPEEEEKGPAPASR